MKLSAIIPTHDRPDVLRQCLMTLRAQDVDPERFEVLVLDDGSAGDVTGLVADTAAGSEIVIRCERQAQGGLNAARNRGTERTEGEVVAFLDDDTLASRGWASALLRAFELQPCAAVGGRIELGLAGPAPTWLDGRRHYLAEYDLGPEAGWIGSDPLPVGANCAVRRSELERLGGFRAGLDRSGSSLVSNGDTEFFRRLRAAGGRLWYEPRASVIHQVPEDRLTIAFFNRRHYAQGLSDEMMRVVEGGASSWRWRLRLAGGILDGARAAGRDLRDGGSSLEGRFEMRYWAGRLRASLLASTKS